MSNEVIAVLVGGGLTIFFGLISSLWIILWHLFESLRKDVSDLREVVISLSAAIANILGKMEVVR